MSLCPGCRLRERKSILLSETGDKIPIKLVPYSSEVIVHYCFNCSCDVNLYFECVGDCHGRMKRVRNGGYFKNYRALSCHMNKYHKIINSSHSQTIPNNNNSTDVFSITQELNHQGENDFADELDDFSVTLSTNVILDTLLESFDGEKETEDLSLNMEFGGQTLGFFAKIAIAFGYFAATCRIVVRAAFQSNSLYQDEANHNQVPKEFSTLFINISRLVASHGNINNGIFSEILCDLFEVIKKMDSFVPADDPLKGQIAYLYRLPITTDDFQTRLQRPSNSNSMHSLLPIPRIIHDAASEHAMCHIAEVVAMAMLIPLDKNSKEHMQHRYKSLVQSESYFEKRKKIPEKYSSRTQSNTKPSIMAYTVIWSDGWDPNRSNKGNRTPVWTATGTFILVEIGNEDQVFSVSTELLCAAPGKSSHNVFFEMLQCEKGERWEDENGKLRPISMYSKIHGRYVNVFICLGLFLQDNPERRGVSELLGGNSNSHGIFGVSCHFDQLVVPFPSCNDCMSKELPYLIASNFNHAGTQQDCEKCMGWSLDKLLRCGRYKKPVHVKLRLKPGDHGYEITLGPAKITYADCKKAWDFAMDMFIDKAKWGVGETSSYLKLFCMNEGLIKRFTKEAKNYIKIREALNRDTKTYDANPELRDEIISNHTQFPKLYHKPKYPPIWDLIATEDVTETPLHLGMGVMKAILKSLFLYCVGRSRMTEFVARCTYVLNLVKWLRLDILPVLTFKNEKFGGYVAENYSALTMIIPWLSAILLEENMKPGMPDEIMDPIEKPVEDWTGKQCSAWLKQRGQSHILKAEAARASVIEILARPNGKVPAIVRNLARELDPNTVRYLTQMGNSLFGCIMSKDIVNHHANNRAQGVIAHFLSVYEKIDQSLMPDRSKPIWVAKYNILGLLRVPEHFLRFRLVRNLYEGGDIGEGMVKQLRLLCPTGVRPGWSKNMLLSFYRKRSMTALHTDAKIGNHMVEKDIPSPITIRFDWPIEKKQLRKFRRYKNYDTVLNNLGFARPLSVIVFKKLNKPVYSFGCVVQFDSHNWGVHRIKVKYENSFVDNHGYRYYNIEINETALVFPKQKMPVIGSYQFHTFGVMLPDLWRDKPDSQPFYNYAFVGEDWEHLKNINHWTHLF